MKSLQNLSWSTSGLAPTLAVEQAAAAVPNDAPVIPGIELTPGTTLQIAAIAAIFATSSATLAGSVTLLQNDTALIPQ
jgi:hypothetical protein